MSYACSLYYGGHKKPSLDELTVIPSTSEQIFTPSASYDGFSKVIVAPAPLTTLEVTPGAFWQRHTPESPAIGYSRVDVNGVSRQYNVRKAYVTATSAYELSVSGFGDLPDIDAIESIHLDLFNYDGQSPVSYAVHGLHMDIYTVSDSRMCSYGVYAMRGSTGYSAYYDGVAFNSGKSPLTVTLVSDEDDTGITIRLTAYALVPGLSTRLIFDTSIDYAVEILYK